MTQSCKIYTSVLKQYSVGMFTPRETTTSVVQHTPRRGRRFYTAMALAAWITVAIGFGPGIIDQTARAAPLTPLVIAHGLVFGAWLVFFLAQTVLVSAGRTATHRRLGMLGAILAVAMIVTGYITAIAVGRRGFDLSGDLNVAADPLGYLVFPLGDLVSFGLLVTAGFWYRHRPDVHKRLMLLATVGSLIPAPLAHLIGHYPPLRAINGIIVLPIALFLFASAVYDRLSRGRMHPVSLWGAILLFVWANLRAVVIGPSPAWQRFAAWLLGD